MKTHLKPDYSKAKQYAIACQESYKPFAEQRFEGDPDTIIPIENSLTDTQCVLLVTDSEMTIVFPGSNSLMDWTGSNLDSGQMRSEFDKQIVKKTITDSDESEKIYPYDEPSQSGVKLHRGFTRAYFSVRDRIHEQIEALGVSKVTVTGHSLGGALAILCGVDVQYNFSEQLEHLEVYTFGAPRVGNDAFKGSFERRVPHNYRIVNGMDLVVELPRWWQGYRSHVETHIRIGKRLSWKVLTAPFQDHAIANYIKELAKRAG